MSIAVFDTAILKWVLVALAVPLLVWLAVHTIRRARALSERIDEYHREQEAAQKQPGPINPYADLDRLMGRAEPPADNEQAEENR